MRQQTVRTTSKPETTVICPHVSFIISLCVMTVGMILPSVYGLADTLPEEKRWVQQDQDIILDNERHLRWTRHDNQADIDWAGARHYCTSLKLDGGHWELPAEEELASLYIRSKSKDDTVACGQLRDIKFGCKVSSLFQLTGPWFWSETSAASPKGENEHAIDVNLIDGRRHPFMKSNSAYGRALCVHRLSQ